MSRCNACNAAAFQLVCPKEAARELVPPRVYDVSTAAALAGGEGEGLRLHASKAGVLARPRPTLTDDSARLASPTDPITTGSLFTARKAHCSLACLVPASNSSMTRISPPPLPSPPLSPLHPLLLLPRSQLVDEFWRCGCCGKVFWMGPKSASAIALVEGMLARARQPGEPLAHSFFNDGYLATDVAAGDGEEGEGGEAGEGEKQGEGEGGQAEGEAEREARERVAAGATAAAAVREEAEEGGAAAAAPDALPVGS